MHRVPTKSPRSRTCLSGFSRAAGAAILCAALALVAGRAGAQDRWTAADSNQAAVSVDALWQLPGSVDSAGVAAGFSIGGVLEVGVGLSLENDEVDGEDAREVGGRITLTVSPLRQGVGVPVSLALHGSYGLTRTHSDYLDEAGKSVRGQGFTAGISLLREFRFQSTSLRLGLSTDYRSYTYITDTEAPPASTTSREGELTYGASVGFGVLLASGALLATDVVATANSDLDIRVGPAVRLSFPTSGN